jgi:glycosyltransferase involved in cell wall biosynthesis
MRRTVLQSSGELRPNLKVEGLECQVPKLSQPIRVLDFLETSWLSGPAKNLIEFARRAAQPNRMPVQANIAIATFHRGSGSPSNDFTVACQRAGLKLHIVREKFAYDPAVISAMRHLIEAYDPDIVQTHGVKSHFLLRLTGAHRRHRWIAFHHGYTWTDLKVRLYNRLDRWSLPASSRVVTVCQAFASAMERIGIPRERITIQHNSVNTFLPVSTDAVAKLRQKLRIPDDAKVLLNVGRLSREKGQAELIKALAILRKQSTDPKLRLVLVGYGPDRRRLEYTADVEGVADWVIFAGHQGDVVPYYSMADLMVLSSRTEGSPNVLLEAMAAGLPIVATAVGGVPEIVCDAKAALLVQTQNPVALARGMLQILDDQNLRARLCSAARKRAAAYSPEAYCDSLLALYRDCMREERVQHTNSSNRQFDKSGTAIRKNAILTD